MATQYMEDPEDSRSYIKKSIGDELDTYTGKNKQYDKQAADAAANRREVDAEVALKRGKRPAPTGSISERAPTLRELLSDAVDKDFNVNRTADAMKADKAAKRHLDNMKEAEVEGTRYAKGGRVTGYRGYGKAKKV